MTALPASHPFGIPPPARVVRGIAGALQPVVTDLTALRDAATDAVTMYRVIGAGERALLQQAGLLRMLPRSGWGVIVLKFSDRSSADRVLQQKRRRSHPNAPLGLAAVRVDQSFADDVRIEIDGRIEYWVDASRLDELNRHMHGPIRLI